MTQGCDSFLGLVGTMLIHSDVDQGTHQPETLPALRCYHGATDLTLRDHDDGFASALW